MAATMFASSAVAQPQPQQEQRLTPERMAQLFPPNVVSPECNADGTVTFRFRAPEAKAVELDCQMFSDKKPMTKDEKGVWSVTVTPPAPDVYPYCFIVDGAQVTDPSNMYIFPNEGFKNSLCDVRAKELTMQDMQNVPHGKITYRYYHSEQYGFDRPLVVYTPAGYDAAGSEKYPVLYLIHGMTDTYETWFKVGRVNIIMDNLIAQGLAKKMIIVMPYANPQPELQSRGVQQENNFMGMMNAKPFNDEMMNSIIPFVEKNYRVLADADNTAMAGFSMGGRQTLGCALANIDKFHYVGAFAPAIFGNEYETNFSNGTYAPLSKLKTDLKLFWLGTGSDDFLIEASRGLDAYLTKNEMKHTFYNPGGGHTWMNCRDYIELLAKELFK